MVRHLAISWLYRGAGSILCGQGYGRAYRYRFVRNDGFDRGDLKTNQLVSILTGVLGILAVFLAFPAGSEVGVWNLGLWAIVGLLIGLATVTALIFTVVWESIRRSKGRRRNLR